MVWCKFGAKKRNMKKIWLLSGTYISETTGTISFKFGICKVVYMVQLKYINLIKSTQ